MTHSCSKMLIFGNVQSAETVTAPTQGQGEGWRGRTERVSEREREQRRQ